MAVHLGDRDALAEHPWSNSCNNVKYMLGGGEEATNERKEKKGRVLKTQLEFTNTRSGLQCSLELTRSGSAVMQGRCPCSYIHISDRYPEDYREPSLEVLGPLYFFVVVTGLARIKRNTHEGTIPHGPVLDEHQC